MIVQIMLIIKLKPDFLIPLKFNICKQSLYVTARIKSYP